MFVAVMVGVKRDLFGRLHAKKGVEGWVFNDGFGGSFTADVPVEADDTIGPCHYDMQIVTDQQDAAPQFVADICYQPVK